MADDATAGEQDAALRGQGPMPGSAASADDPASRIARLAARLFDAPAAMLFVADADGDRAGAMLGLDAAEAAPARDLCLSVARQREPLLSADAPEAAAGGTLRFRAAAPVIGSDGGVIGALAVFDRRPRPDVAPALSVALGDLAAVAATALEGARAREADPDEAGRAALRDRLKTLAVEAPGFDAAVQATTRALSEATGARLCTLHRLGADGESLQLVGGFAGEARGGTARLRTVRGWLEAAAPLLATAIAEGRQVVLPQEDAPVALNLVATPLRIGDERCVLLLGCTAPPAQVTSLLRDAAATLRPLLQMLRDEERTLLHRRVVESSSEAVLITEATPDEGRIVHVNPAFEALTGFAAGELVGRTPLMLQGPDAPGEAWRAIGEAVRRPQRMRQPAVFHRKDGTSVWVELHIAPVSDPGGRCTHLVAMVRDVTRELEATLRLAESEAAFRSLFERNPIPMWIYDHETLAFLSVNDAAVEDYGWSRDDFLHMSILDILPPEDREAVRLAAAQARRDRNASGPWRHLTEAGAEKIVQVISHLTVFAGRRAVLAAVLDVTARTRFERDLAISRAESQRQAVELRQTQRLARLGTWRWHAGSQALFWSEEVHGIFGTDPAGPQPTYSAALAMLHPEDRSRVETAISRIAATGRPGAFEFRVGQPGKRVVHCRAEGQWEMDPETGDGTVRGYVQDVTEQRETEAALRQADRLNSLGQLTGGIAHDFNNLLTVASVSLEMAAEAARENRTSPDLIDAARSALQRGTQLTSQLLSYARRQPLRPEPLDLSRLLPERLDLLQRSLGERHSVRFEAGEMEPVSADPAQLEAALLNLLVNARDAMPVGGPIVVETRVVEIGAEGPAPGEDLAPGRYVMIAVADAGTGMPPEVKARIFEPFFTTKPPGRGTGLGLPMVLGFAKQSGGHVSVTSELGHGTTFRLYLPAVEPGADTIQRPDEPAAMLPEGLDVLVVEDQPDVREAAVRLCTQAGLEPLAVGSAVEALEVLGSGLRFDLVFTDVVLGGGMDGLELAETALRLQPGIAVVCTSGYSEAHAGPHDALAPGLELLTKPYDLPRFRAAVSRALTAAAAQATPTAE